MLIILSDLIFLNLQNDFEWQNARIVKNMLTKYIAFVINVI